MRGDTSDHWGCGVTKEEKQLRKKVRKLYRWARKHGYGWVDACVIGPELADPRWYASVTVSDSIDTADRVSVHQFFDGSDDE